MVLSSRRSMISEMTGEIEGAADRIIGEFEEMTIPRAVRAVELRVLAQIQQIPIREMVRRLSRGA